MILQYMQYKFYDGVTCCEILSQQEQRLVSYHMIHSDMLAVCVEVVVPRCSLGLTSRTSDYDER